MGFRRTDQVQSELRSGSKQTPGLGKIGVTILQAQANHGVIQDRHVVPSVSQGQPGSIFSEGDIPAIMQAILHLPIPADEHEQFLGEACCAERLVSP